MTRNPVIRLLAEALLAGGHRSPALTQACVAVLGGYPHFSGRLVKRLMSAFPGKTRPPRRQVEAFLAADQAVQGFLRRVEVPARDALRPPPAMAPAKEDAFWAVPAIQTEGELAEWLGLDFSRLLWLADGRSLERRVAEGPLRRYRRYWVSKKRGSARLIESPKPLLKTIQQRILARILDRIPAHSAAHGFRPGHSTATFARPHTGKEMVLRMDLRDFFSHISRARVAAIFRTAGYPELVANLLPGLCCTVTPADALFSRPGGPADWILRKTLEIPHLPQGGPTSPALANLCAFRLDGRLAGLAKAAGVNYTRYADDLTFSGGHDFARSVRRFEITVAVIVLEEGFQVQHRKTRIMPKSVSQRTAGLVVNERVAIPREVFERLKAILCNCVRFGPDSQNRDGHPDFRAHLKGHIARVAATDPRRGARLQRVWEQIRWEG